MFPEPRRRFRMRFTPKLFLYAAADVFGVLVFASGLFWLVHGGTLFFKSFPRNLAEAWIGVVGGLVVLVWAAAKLMHERVRQMAEQEIAEGLHSPPVRQSAADSEPER